MQLSMQVTRLATLDIPHHTKLIDFTRGNSQNGMFITHHSNIAVSIRESLLHKEVCLNGHGGEGGGGGGKSLNFIFAPPVFQHSGGCVM